MAVDPFPLLAPLLVPLPATALESPPLKSDAERTLLGDAPAAGEARARALRSESSDGVEGPPAVLLRAHTNGSMPGRRTACMYCAEVP